MTENNWLMRILVADQFALHIRPQLLDRHGINVAEDVPAMSNYVCRKIWLIKREIKAGR